MTNLDVNNTSPAETPVISLTDRLAKIRDTTEQLQVDAQWLAIDTEGLLEDLTGIAEGPTTAETAAEPDAALDAASWAAQAAKNIEGELGELVVYLDATFE